MGRSDPGQLGGVGVFTETHVRFAAQGVELGHQARAAWREARRQPATLGGGEYVECPLAGRQDQLGRVQIRRNLRLALEFEQPGLREAATQRLQKGGRIIGDRLQERRRFGRMRLAPQPGVVGQRVGAQAHPLALPVLVFKDQFDAGRGDIGLGAIISTTASARSQSTTTGGFKRSAISFSRLASASPSLLAGAPRRWSIAAQLCVSNCIILPKKSG